MPALAAVRSHMGSCCTPDHSTSALIFPLPQNALFPFSSAMPMSAGWAVGSRHAIKIEDPFVPACSSPLGFPVIFQWVFPLNTALLLIYSHFLLSLNKEHMNLQTHKTKEIYFSYEAWQGQDTGKGHQLMHVLKGVCSFAHTFLEINA